VKKQPSRALYQLVGQLALQQARYPEALADFEAAQTAGADERVGINQVRAELGQILTVARQVAVQSTGAARKDALAQALDWGDRWRAIDPGNPQIDQLLGELELAIGDKNEGWRQLSSVIERDPMSGDGYQVVANAFEQQGRVVDALDYWEQAIRIDQTNPTPRLRKAQALIALGRGKEGDAVLREIAGRKWHEKWDGVVYQVNDLLHRN
jgi:tetratricopeptide (TPR) repeat protein